MEALRDEPRESGFTLVEFLVVILIIDVLSSIAIPLFLNQRKQAVDTQLRADMKNVATWLETNKIKNSDSQYPRLANKWYALDGVTSTTYSNWPSEVKLSPNTGVITSDSSASQAFFGGQTAPAGAGFCIEGQALNSNFILFGTDTPVRMYYNSLKGGFSSSCKL